ncbi:MAG: glycosyltransferase family 1 protein [Promethearchaeota archaeon]|nr:MAG: glycosyltransferase family 1 protein [Candidatus Lokiarchaeota archaeon]
MAIHLNMKKMKICLVSLTVSPDSADGEAKVVRSHFDYLKKRGYDVKLISGKWNTDLKHPDIIQFDLIRKRFLWVFHFNYKVIKFLRAHNFDIVHANSAKAAIPVLFSNTKRLITTIHDFTPFETQLTRFPFEKYLIKFIASKSAIITTVSNTIRNKFKKFLPGIDLNKVLTIYNGIEERFKPYPRKSVELKRKLGLEGPIIIYIGRITAYKGVDYIISAYHIVKKSNPKVNLIIGGNPDFLMEKKYQKWIKQHQDISFVGYVSEEELPYYYSMADIFINYSSSSEGFGLTPLEALACGTPIICSSIKVYKEIFEDSALFVPPKNSNKLADSILKLLSDKNLRDELVQNAQKVLSKYSWDVVINRLEKIYTRLNPN